MNDFFDAAVQQWEDQVVRDKFAFGGVFVEFLAKLGIRLELLAYEFSCSDDRQVQALGNDFGVRAFAHARRAEKHCTDASPCHRFIIRNMTKLQGEKFVLLCVACARSRTECYKLFRAGIRADERRFIE